jgi:hypothetical protein
VRRKSQTEIREAKSRKRPGNNQVRTPRPDDHRIQAIRDQDQLVSGFADGYPAPAWVNDVHLLGGLLFPRAANLDALRARWQHSKSVGLHR